MIRTRSTLDVVLSAGLSLLSVVACSQSDIRQSDIRSTPVDGGAGNDPQAPGIAPTDGGIRDARPDVTAGKDAADAEDARPTDHPDALVPPATGCDPTFGVAHYVVSFEATWSKATHPSAFASGAHFTPIVGGTHSAALVVWRAGGVATAGVQAVAEQGDTSLLSKEIENAIVQGTAGVVLVGQGIDPPPGTDRATFDIEPGHPLVSLAAMLAPSPDWFTGVDSVSLCGPAGWLQSAVADARVYDAGTKSGESLSYDGHPTHDPIQLRDYGLFAGKTLVGHFHFTRM